MKSILLSFLFSAFTCGAFADPQTEEQVLTCLAESSYLIEISSAEQDGHKQFTGKISGSDLPMLAYNLLPPQTNAEGRTVFADRALPIYGINFKFYLEVHNTSSARVSFLHDGGMPLYNVPCKIAAPRP